MSYESERYRLVQVCEMSVEKAINAIGKGSEGDTRMAALHLGALEVRLRELRYAIWNADNPPAAVNDPIEAASREDE